MRSLIVSLFAAPLVFGAPFVLGAGPALAQSNPSADQIIQSLKPSGDLLSGHTRGIRLANPSATAATPQVGDTQAGTQQAPVHQATMATAPATTPRAAEPATAAVSAPSVNLSVEFATGSAGLTPQARRTLDQLGRALASHDLAQYHFRIEGHTDTVGSPELNKALSQRRAETVAAYLEQNYGIARTRLEAIGMGEEGLAVPTPPQTANSQNRRVKVVNLGA